MYQQNQYEIKCRRIIIIWIFETGIKEWAKNKWFAVQVEDKIGQRTDVEITRGDILKKHY